MEMMRLLEHAQRADNVLRIRQSVARLWKLSVVIQTLHYVQIFSVA